MIYAARQRQAQTSAAWSQCAALAGEPDILQKFDQSVTRRGMVGERRAARLVYLSVTSRFFARPVSTAIKGPSSGRQVARRANRCSSIFRLAPTTR